MSETNTLQSFSVTRNNLSLPFVPVKKTRGTSKSEYPCLVLTKENLREGLEWLGEEVVLSLINPKLKQRCQNWFGEATVEADGTTPKPFDQEEFSKFASEFNARGESIKDLIAEKDELSLEMANLPWGTPGVEVKAQELGMRIRILLTAIENKRRKKDEDETPAAPVAVGS